MSSARTSPGVGALTGWRSRAATAGDALHDQHAAVVVGGHQPGQPHRRTVPDEGPVDRDLVVEVGDQLFEVLAPHGLRGEALGHHRRPADGARHQDVAAPLAQHLARGEGGAYPRDPGEGGPDGRGLECGGVDPLLRHGLARPGRRAQQPAVAGADGGDPGAGHAGAGGLGRAQSERGPGGLAPRVPGPAVGGARGGGPGRRRDLLRAGTADGCGGGRSAVRVVVGVGEVAEEYMG